MKALLYLMSLVEHLEGSCKGFAGVGSGFEHGCSVVAVALVVEIEAGVVLRPVLREV